MRRVKKLNNVTTVCYICTLHLIIVRAKGVVNQLRYANFMCGKKSTFFMTISWQYYALHPTAIYRIVFFSLKVELWLDKQFVHL